MYAAELIARAAAGMVLAAALSYATDARADREPPARIEAAAEAHARNALPAHGRLEAEARALDDRLRLERCGEALATSTRGEPRGRHVTVEVSCPGPSPWRIYVPVELAEPGRVVVAARPLPRGHRLAAGDLKLAEHDVRRLPRGYHRDVAALAGRTLRRDVHAGEVIDPQTVAAGLLVERGQQVRLVARSRGIEVEAAGRALVAGGAGRRVRVVNLSSGRELEGRVVGPGVVEVAGF
jgi:flagella basal body P-ring formation protein FlgA